MQAVNEVSLGIVDAGRPGAGAAERGGCKDAERDRDDGYDPVRQAGCGTATASTRVA